VPWTDLIRCEVQSFKNALGHPEANIQGSIEIRGLYNSNDLGQGLLSLSSNSNKEVLCLSWYSCARALIAHSATTLEVRDFI
jgi:hypothetical protein